MCVTNLDSLKKGYSIIQSSHRSILGGISNRCTIKQFPIAGNASQSIPSAFLCSFEAFHRPIDFFDLSKVQVGAVELLYTARQKRTLVIKAGTVLTKKGE
jgi:hypothetical protein